MTAWPFLLYATAVVCWYALHLLPALLALKRLRGEQSVEIDMEYVRSPDHHARAIRQGESPSIPAQPFVVASQETPGTLLCESNCEVQERARVEAIVSLGSLTLREHVIVRQFADSRGEMIIGSQCSVGGPATSGTAIRLGRNVSVRSLFAPEITTFASEIPTGGASPERAQSVDAEPVRIPPSAAQGSQQFRGKLRQLSEDTWLHEGDLRVSAPLSVACKLIVSGSLSVPSGSILRDDVKSTGDLIVGEDCICHGSMVSDRDIELGGRTTFGRSIHAGGELRLKSGVRGEGPGDVAAFARSRVLLGEGILVRGRIASEGSVIST